MRTYVSGDVDVVASGMLCLRDAWASLLATRGVGHKVHLECSTDLGLTWHRVKDDGTPE